MKPDGESLLDVRDLEVHFPIHASAAGRLFGRASGYVKAVDGVSFLLRRGEVLGLVGESGSGKTTLGRALLGLVKPTAGSIRYGDHDFSTLSEREFRPLRRRLQMVFQDPHASLNPSMDIEHAVGHPLRIHRVTKRGAETRRRVVEALERVGLSPVDRFLSAYPADLSGGQKQRAAIARAVVLGPELLVADEPVSMLDMSVRAKILELMLQLKNELGLTYVYITHDLATAKFFCDRVAIMYLGRIVEIGPAAEIYAEPRHPYTRSLLAAIPEPDPDHAVPRDLPRGEIPDAAAPPSGCSFHPRCPRAFDVCGWESRDLRALLEQRWLALDKESYAAERSLLGDLDRLDAPGADAQLVPGNGDTAAVTALLERSRADNPDDPFWSGVSSIAVERGAVVIGFQDGVDPALRSVGEVGWRAICTTRRTSAEMPEAYDEAGAGWLRWLVANLCTHRFRETADDGEPSPVLPDRRVDPELACANFSNNRGRKVSGTPGPQSAMTSLTLSPSRWAVTDTGASPYFAALSNKLMQSRSRCSASARARRSESISTINPSRGVG